MRQLSHYRQTIIQDLLAGATGAVAGAPQAMGFALIAGLSPIYGLYTAVISTIVAGMTSSSSMLTVGPTNALSLVVASTLIGFDEAGQIERLIVLTLLVGIFQLAFGVFKLGMLTRFVSNAVMTGFITGAGLLIIFGQLDHMVGIESHGDTVLARLWDWLTHLGDADLRTTIMGIGAAVIIWALHHTRFKSIATLVAITITSGIILLFDWTQVELVRDMAAIPSGLPPFVLPDVAQYAQSLLPAALAMAVLGSVQSAAITQNVPDRDGTYSDTNQDFSAQGLGNIAGAFFQGMPACGSLSRTAVNVSAGAQSRMANIYAGALIAAMLVAFGGVIEQITLAALAGHLVVAAASLISVESIREVWNVNPSARAAMVATFAATLLLPLEYSIYIGVILSLALYVYTSAVNIKVTHLEPVDTQTHLFRESEIPATLPADQPVVFSVYGHLYFAAVQALATQLPDPTESQRTVVILRLRHNQYLGTTGLRFLKRYAEKLKANGGKLLLSGVSEDLRVQLERTDALAYFGKDSIFYSNEIVFDATEDAIRHAHDWLSGNTLKSAG